MLIMQACVCVRVRLMQSCSGAAPQANLSQTLRMTVTFKNNLPLSHKIDDVFVTFSVSLVPALQPPHPPMYYLRTEKD